MSKLFPTLECAGCGDAQEHRVMGLERGSGLTIAECVRCKSLRRFRAPQVAAGVSALPGGSVAPAAATCASCDRLKEQLRLLHADRKAETAASMETIDHLLETVASLKLALHQAAVALDAARAGGAALRDRVLNAILRVDGATGPQGPQECVSATEEPATRG